ncbi:MAG TPA: hypothetical protein VK841_24790 [Polyangiaceae bacterium]|jgi:hypothetical protein|nr:hypothetical protein [Polyangiaceae bacterium]
MSRRGRLAVVALLGLLGTSGCLFPTTDDDVYGPTPTSSTATGDVPLCVTSFPAGTTLHMVLGEVYDLTSDYLYEDSFLRYAGYACGDKDVLSTGSALAVTLQTTLSGAQISNSGYVCTPYAQFDPAALQGDSELPEYTVTEALGVTIVAAFDETTVAGAPAYWTTVVQTPSENPNGTLTEAQLPPLVVSRSLVMASDYALVCNDIWVATLESGP